MSIQIFSIGTKVAPWSAVAFNEYQKRLPKTWRTSLIEVPASKRLKGRCIEQLLELESEKLWQHSQHCAPNVTIALDRTGRSINSNKMAESLGAWVNKGCHVQFLIGGPEGMTESVLKKCTQVWSFSELTFPHPLVRVILIEQVYRAFCINSNKTYHR